MDTFLEVASAGSAWFRLETWRVAWVLNVAAIESCILLGTGLTPPRAQTLARVADALDSYMRSPAFLNNMRLGLRILSGSWWPTPARAHRRKKGSR